MSLYIFTPEQKLRALQRLIRDLKDLGIRPVDVLKAIAADYEARADVNRGRALNELSRALIQVSRSKTPLGYSTTSQIIAAQQLIRWWPTVQQALEMFGEESAE